MPALSPRPAAAGYASRIAAAVALLAVALLAVAPGVAHASQQGVEAMKKWRAMDACAVQAHAAFPDFSAEANAKREAKLKQCLTEQRLPPRAPASPAR